MAVCLRGRAGLLYRCNLSRDASLKRCFSSTSWLREVQDSYQASGALPEYPPIYDTSPKAKKQRQVHRWHKLIQDMPTVEEKQLELNMPRFYGYWMAHLFSHGVHYNYAEFTQFVTRSNIATEQWPDVYHSLDESVKKYLPHLKRKVEDILILELIHRTRLERSPVFQEKEVSSNIIWAIHHAITGLLGSHVEHIADSQSDQEGRLDAFWWSEGIPVDTHNRGMRERNPNVPEQDYDLPMCRPLQYQGSAALLVRGRLPLPQLVCRDAPACLQATPLALENREPRSHHLSYQLRHGTNVPGVWSGDARQCPLVVWMTRHHLQRHARMFGPHACTDQPDALHAQACLTGFATALAQACHHGFTPLTELTYPVTSQTVITDGRHWSFSCYQLNTTAALLRQPEQGSLANVCWSQPQMQLFESVTENGVEGLNESVLERLLQIYLLPPGDRDGISLRPHLNPELAIDKLEDDLLRTRYREEYFRAMSNRPRHVRMDEIYLWEQIYKVRHATRPQEARKRFFELNEFPARRRLDDMTPVYVPRACRPANVPGYLKAASKFEPNPYHWLARLRGRRLERPYFVNELEELENWRSKDGEKK